MVFLAVLNSDPGRERSSRRQNGFHSNAGHFSDRVRRGLERVKSNSSQTCPCRTHDPLSVVAHDEQEAVLAQAAALQPGQRVDQVPVVQFQAGGAAVRQAGQEGEGEVAPAGVAGREPLPHLQEARARELARGAEGGALLLPVQVLVERSASRAGGRSQGGNVNVMLCLEQCFS